MTDRDAATEALLLDGIRSEAGRIGPGRCLLIGAQACSTVQAANAILGAERVLLLHLDQAAGAVGCGLGNAEQLLGDDPAATSQFALVAVNVDAAKSYRLLREIVGQTARYVGEAGVVLVAGPKKGGAEVAATTLREQFEQVELLAYRKGRRVFRALGSRRPGAADAGHSDPSVAETVTTVTLRGHEIHLIQDERIFARGRLDPATRMLAEVFEAPPDATILDLGCGSGVLGILAARLAPSSRVFLVDSDPLAVAATRRNAALNGVGNVSVEVSDLLAALPGQTFDVVVMNPPFHRGRQQDTSIVERFLRVSGQALRPGGRLYVVCNRFLPYEGIIERLVGPVREVAGDRYYKVLMGKARAPRAQVS